MAGLFLERDLLFPAPTGRGVRIREGGGKKGGVE